MLKILFATGIEDIGMVSSKVRKEIILAINHARAKGATKTPASSGSLFVLAKSLPGGVVPS
jgi:hypothetical protein